MTTDPTTPAPDPTAAVFRRALRDTAILLGTLAVLGIGVGALVAGLPGVWGALVGVGLALVFSGTTVVAMLRTLHSSPHTMAAVVMGTWLAKVLVVVVVLALGVVGSALLDYRAVAHGRVPYVEPGSAGR